MRVAYVRPLSAWNFRSSQTTPLPPFAKAHAQAVLTCTSSPSAPPTRACLTLCTCVYSRNCQLRLPDNGRHLITWLTRYTSGGKNPQGVIASRLQQHCDGGCVEFPPTGATAMPGMAVRSSNRCGRYTLGRASGRWFSLGLKISSTATPFQSPIHPSCCTVQYSTVQVLTLYLLATNRQTAACLRDEPVVSRNPPLPQDRILPKDGRKDLEGMSRQSETL